MLGRIKQNRMKKLIILKLLNLTGLEERDEKYETTLFVQSLKENDQPITISVPPDNTVEKMDELASSADNSDMIQELTESVCDRNIKYSVYF